MASFVCLSQLRDGCGKYDIFWSFWLLEFGNFFLQIWLKIHELIELWVVSENSSSKTLKVTKVKVKLSISHLQETTFLFLSINCTFCFHLTIITKHIKLLISAWLHFEGKFQNFSSVMNFFLFRWILIEVQRKQWKDLTINFLAISILTSWIKIIVTYKVFEPKLCDTTQMIDFLKLFKMLLDFVQFCLLI